MPIEAPTLHDTLSQAYDKDVAPNLEAPVEAPVVAPTEPEPVAPVEAAETPQQKEQRERDEKGRFVESKEKPEKDAKAAPAPAAAAVEKLGVKRPDSWKKELWTIWDKLDEGKPLTKEERKTFLEYIPQRETEYQKGVSTYKTEWDRARPLLDSIAPYQPFLQQMNLRPEQFVSALAQTDQVLRFGTPQQKLQTFAKFAQDYQIPLQELFVQGEDGKVYLNQQFQQQQPQALTPDAVRNLVKQEAQRMQMAQSRAQFLSTMQRMEQEKDKDGNLLYPHMKDFNATMGGLLRSGAVTGTTPEERIRAAYETTLRLPQHSALFEARSQQEKAKEEARKKQEEAERVARARANAASPKSSTPTGQTPDGGKKALRDQLSENFDRHVAGRV